MFFSVCPELVVKADYAQFRHTAHVEGAVCANSSRIASLWGGSVSRRDVFGNLLR